jgi:hypothetical protein
MNGIRLLKMEGNLLYWVNSVSRITGYRMDDHSLIPGRDFSAV